MRADCVPFMAVVLALPASVFAGAVLSVTGPGGANSVIVNEGESFDVEFRVSVDRTWMAVGCGLEELNPHSNLGFRISGRITHGDGLTAPPSGAAVTPNVALFGASGFLDPVSGNIGYFDFNAYELYPATEGSLLLATLTLSNSAPMGGYTIQIGDPRTEPRGVVVPDTDPFLTTVGAPLVVTVVPEPMSSLPIGLAGLLLWRPCPGSRLHAKSARKPSRDFQRW